MIFAFASHHNVMITCTAPGSPGLAIGLAWLAGSSISSPGLFVVLVRIVCFPTPSSSFPLSKLGRTQVDPRPADTRPRAPPRPPAPRTSLSKDSRAPPRPFGPGSGGPRTPRCLMELNSGRGPGGRPERLPHGPRVPSTYLPGSARLRSALLGSTRLRSATLGRDGRVCLTLWT